MSHNRAEASRLLRSLRDEKRTTAVARSVAHRRSSGFAVTITGARPYFVRLHDAGEWSWTIDRHEAELFPSEERAAAWAARHIGGGEPTVVGVML